MFFIDLEPQPNNKKIFEQEFISNSKITVEPPRKKRDIVQCTRCQEYGHSKAYCFKPYNCVKYGDQHDTRECQKPKNTPAKCALCDGDHPANYKGCSVYKDLIQKRSLRQKPNKITNPPRHSTAQTEPLKAKVNEQQNYYRSYADATRNRHTYMNEQQSHGPQEQQSQELGTKLIQFLEEFKSMFSQLMNQNSMILNLLTSVIKKLN